MSGFDDVYLAALLEGEGYFGTRIDRRNESTTATISVSMTDEDVMERVADLMGTRPVQLPQRGTFKVQYRATLTGSRAAAVMKRVLPYMGRRRTEAICLALGDWYESRMAVCQVCDKEFSYGDRPRHSRTHLCGDECRRVRLLSRRATWARADRARKAA